MEITLQIIVTSGIVSSIIGFIFKQIFDRQLIQLKENLTAKNKALEIELSSIKGREKHNYELMIASLRNIWTCISRIEDYLLIGINNNFDFNTQYSEVRKEVHNIRNELLFLPDEIYNPIDKFLNELFSVHLQNFHNKTALYAQAKKLTGKISIETNPSDIATVNAFLAELQKDFWTGRDKLRIDIRAYLKNAFGVV